MVDLDQKVGAERVELVVIEAVWLARFLFEVVV